MNKRLIIAGILIIIFVLIIVIVIMSTTSKKDNGNNNGNNGQDTYSTRTVRALDTDFMWDRTPVNFEDAVKTDRINIEGDRVVAANGLNSPMYIYEQWPSITDIKENDYVLEFILRGRIGGSNVTTGFVHNTTGFNNMHKYQNLRYRRDAFGLDFRQQSGETESQRRLSIFNKNEDGNRRISARWYGHGTWYQIRIYIINGGMVYARGRDNIGDEWRDLGIGPHPVLEDYSYRIGMWDTAPGLRAGIDASVSILKKPRVLI